MRVEKVTSFIFQLRTGKNSWMLTVVNIFSREALASKNKAAVSVKNS